MRCKKHPADQSSSVGVCASCLRDRLFVLIAAQARAQPAHPPPPPPLAFPRSVSPYVARRKSGDSRDPIFYSTPQVGPGCLPPAKKKNHCRRSFLSHLFRSRSKKFDSDPDPQASASPPHRGSSRTSSSSPSWFSFIPVRRRAPSRLSSVGEPVADNKSSWVSDRGMSPARGADSESRDFEEASPSGSGYSLESSPGWRKTPAAGVTPARLRARPAYPRNMSGLSFCLSPLVRASPGRHWKQKKAGGGSHSEIGYSGEMRVSSARPHISAAASFCANRSRKLADFGRTNRNR